MIPAQFDYVRPGDLDETLRILKDREGEAKLLSGGYSLIPLIKLRLAQPALLVDLRDVTGLDGIVETDDYLRIGARATHRQIHEADDRPRPLPAAPRRDRDDRRSAGPQLGHDRRLRRPRRPGVRLAGGPPRGATRRSSAAARPASATIAARDFFLDTFQTAIEPTEVLTEIRIARRPRAVPAARTRSSSARSATSRRSASPRSSGWTPTARSQRAGIGLTGVADTPFAATDAEAVLVGNAPSDDLFRAAGAAAGAQSRPFGDVRGPVDYKRAMAAELTVRALRSRHRARPRVRVGGRTMTTQHITVTVNGEAHEADVEPRLLLVHFLRDDLGLTGTHVGCDTSNCGACTVHVDGESAKSCTMLAVQADGREIKTIEGMADGANLHPLQQAFWDQHGLQCGFCTPGMIMQAAWLLDAEPATRPRRRSARGSAATSAAAPAT